MVTITSTHISSEIFNCEITDEWGSQITRKKARKLYDKKEQLNKNIIRHRPPFIDDSCPAVMTNSLTNSTTSNRKNTSEHPVEQTSRKIFPNEPHPSKQPEPITTAVRANSTKLPTTAESPPLSRVFPALIRKSSRNAHMRNSILYEKWEKV